MWVRMDACAIGQLIEYVKTHPRYWCAENNPDHIAKALAGKTGWFEDTQNCSPGNRQNENNITGFNALPAGWLNGNSAA